MSEFAFSVTKHIHVWCVTISFILFVMRSLWHIKHSQLLQRRWVKIVPHCVDTLLLATGIVLMNAIFGLGLTAAPLWLILKLALLLTYIALGLLAFKVEKTQKAFIVAALLAFSTMTLLSINKPIAPFLVF